MIKVGEHKGYRFFIVPLHRHIFTSHPEELVLGMCSIDTEHIEPFATISQDHPLPAIFRVINYD